MGVAIALSLSVLIHKMGVAVTATSEGWILRVNEVTYVSDIATHKMSSSLQGSSFWPGS